MVKIIKENEIFTSHFGSDIVSLDKDNTEDAMYTEGASNVELGGKTAVTTMPSQHTQRIVDALMQRQQSHTGPGVEVGSFPVAKNCIIRLLATGPLTESGVKVLIQQLQLGVGAGIFDNDPKPTDGSDLA